MQQILNNQERTQAFLKFLLFFLFTIILVVMAVFFNYRLPSRENKLLTEEVEIQRQQETQQQKFVNKMEEANQLLDSLSKYPASFESLSMQVTGKITELSVLQQKDNTAYGKLNKTIINKLSDLVLLRKQLYPLLEANGKISNLQSDLEKCKTELLTVNAQLDAYRNAK